VNRALVEEYWSKLDCSESDKNFYMFPPIKSRSCKLIFDEYDASREDWTVFWTAEKILKPRIPFESALSICCGFGSIERSLATLNIAERIEGIDIAPGAIAQAVERAREQGLDNITYRILDINEAELPQEEYDLVWANAALHHIENLEHAISTLYRALKPGGVLVAHEYIGPKYQQIKWRQAEIVNAVRHLLPHELRADFSDSNHKDSLGHKVKTRLKGIVQDRFFQDYLHGDDRQRFGKIWNGTPIEHFLQNDPSESIRGEEIIPILKSVFDEVEVRPFHGSILFYALDEIFYDNFDPANPKHRQTLELLFNIEDAMIAAGELQNENAHIICWKK
jgi:ubiquinone/menaquinone biosynthesis C-methylase UbiE